MPCLIYVLKLSVLHALQHADIKLPISQHRAC